MVREKAKEDAYIYFTLNTHFECLEEIIHIRIKRFLFLKLSYKKDIKKDSDEEFIGGGGDESGVDLQVKSAPVKSIAMKSQQIIKLEPTIVNNEMFDYLVEPKRKESFGADTFDLYKDEIISQWLKLMKKLFYSFDKKFNQNQFFFLRWKQISKQLKKADDFRLTISNYNQISFISKLKEKSLLQKEILNKIKSIAGVLDNKDVKKYFIIWKKFSKYTNLEFTEYYFVIEAKKLRSNPSSEIQLPIENSTLTTVNMTDYNVCKYNSCMFLENCSCRPKVTPRTLMKPESDDEIKEDEPAVVNISKTKEVVKQSFLGELAKEKCKGLKLRVTFNRKETDSMKDTLDPLDYISKKNESKRLLNVVVKKEDKKVVVKSSYIQPEKQTRTHSEEDEIIEAVPEINIPKQTPQVVTNNQKVKVNSQMPNTTNMTNQSNPSNPNNKLNISKPIKPVEKTPLELEPNRDNKDLTSKKSHPQFKTVTLSSNNHKEARNLLRKGVNTEGTDVVIRDTGMTDLSKQVEGYSYNN